MKILLHTCCAPCLIHPLRVLSERGYEVVPYFYNPNIQPFREYRQRYFTVLDYCRAKGLELRTGPYEMERFLLELSGAAARVALNGTVAGPGGATDRCAGCYRIRLGRTAAVARTLGIGDFTSTLLVSPYQDQSTIRKVGEDVSIENGVMFLFEDMSDGFREASRQSRDMGMYRQSYCGCVYSEKERYQKNDPPLK
ncbi:MAG: epoxyqueuosine reductase QueH [Actinobacteria bacterium]|nr:epoxyqueuosine reductase QueH [Actinomycetota bacterium]